MTSIGFSKKFDKNVSSIIAEFITPKPYKFLDWDILHTWLNESMLVPEMKRILKIRQTFGPLISSHIEKQHKKILNYGLRFVTKFAKIEMRSI
jgi:hypothetical protein